MLSCVRACVCQCAGGVAHLIFTHVRVSGDKGSFTETLKGY